MRVATLLSFFVLLQACGSGVHERPGAPQGLLCELLRYPEKAAITDSTPEFSWIVNDSRRGAVQTAYQILLARSPDELVEDVALWDSGRVESNRSVDVEYAGAPLEAGQSYWWKVRSWDSGGVPSPYSRPQQFHLVSSSANEREWPHESLWRQLPDGEWVLENRQKAEPVEQTPVSLVRIGDRWVADFGRAAFGTLRLRLDASRSDETVAIYLGERLTEAGLVHKEPGRSHIGFQKITLELREGTDEYLLELPRHELRYPNSRALPSHIPEVTPFRYAEIENAPTRLARDDLRRVALFYPFDDDSSGFVSSRPHLTRVWELCKYTLQATPFLSLYLDGNRERMPYEADAYIQQLGHYAVDREFAVARYSLEFLLHRPSWPTEWHLHTVLMAWADYMHTGNLDLVRRNYPLLRKKTLLELSREDGLISTRTGQVTPSFLAGLNYQGSQFRDIVDWPAGTPVGEAQAGNRGPTPEGERDGYEFRDYNTVVNAFHYRSLVLLSRLADALGKEDEGEQLARRAERVRESFNRVFLDRGRGLYVDGEGSEHASLHANMFPLAFELVPEAYVDSVADHVVSRGMACSVYGAQYLLEALYRAGRAREALALMTSENRRSWMNMIQVGSTMTTEAWDEYYKPNLTWNHAWGSAPANILVRKLMGIEPLEPGFSRFRVHPQPASLDEVSLVTPSIRGGIETRWAREGNRFRFELLVPANSRAEVWLPAGEENLREGASILEEAEGIELLQARRDQVVLEVAAGRYRFEGLGPIWSAAAGAAALRGALCSQRRCSSESGTFRYRTCTLGE